MAWHGMACRGCRCSCSCSCSCTAKSTWFGTSDRDDMPKPPHDDMYVHVGTHCSGQRRERVEQRFNLQPIGHAKVLRSIDTSSLGMAEDNPTPTGACSSAAVSPSSRPFSFHVVSWAMDQVSSPETCCKPAVVLCFCSIPYRHSVSLFSFFPFSLFSFSFFPFFACHLRLPCNQLRPEIGTKAHLVGRWRFTAPWMSVTLLEIHECRVQALARQAP
ncbi:uncharacterized protein J3D65DRAFT_96711 [Phyllosticta citribraziliensis]|uniref:Uncharacterized protein n=1 Tax=Phyllosticta citribraziliensis TaxID=989973 RepID=A0ABR1LAC7_9PEZI